MKWIIALSIAFLPLAYGQSGAQNPQHSETSRGEQDTIPSAPLPSVSLTQSTNTDPFADLPNAASNTNQSSTSSNSPQTSSSHLFDDLYAKIDEQEARKGDPVAQFNLGLDFLNGKFQKKDPQEAFKWFKKSADQGCMPSEHNLGWMYDNGVGVEQDYAEAAKWYKKAANQGDAQAQIILGSMYSEGDGVERNYSTAAKWYKKAADQGDAQGACNLAFMYFNGTGVPQSNTEAAKQFKTASDGGNLLATSVLGSMYQNGQGVKKSYSIANKYYKKAAGQGEALAELVLGDNYRLGVGFSVDYKTSFNWYMKAAMQGNSEGLGKVGMMYEMGYGVPKNEIEALAWYNLECQTSDPLKQGMENWRNNLEKKVGTAASLVAQQRSKEIQASLQAGAVVPNQRSQSSGLVECSGTGVVISSDGLILTAGHVVNGAVQIEVQTALGKFPAKVVQFDSANDIALIKCEGSFKASPIIPSKDVLLGQSVFTIGYPNVDFQGYSPKVTKGEISSMNGVQDDPREWQISVPVQPGNSGGPLFDEKGNVIGIVLSKLNAVKMMKYTGDVPENVGYAIKSSYIFPLLGQFSSTLAPKNESSAGTVDSVHRVAESVVLILCSSAH